MTTTNLYVYKDLNKNAEYMKDEVGESVFYDVSYREIVVLDTKIRLYYINGLFDGMRLNEQLKMLVRTNDNEKERDKIDDIIQNRLVNEQVDPHTKLEDVTDQLLAGLVAVFIDGVRHAYIVDVRQYPGR